MPCAIADRQRPWCAKKRHQRGQCPAWAPIPRLATKLPPQGRRVASTFEASERLHPWPPPLVPGIGSGGLNILLGHGGRALDEWARQALERKPSITLDPLKAPIALTVIITRPIML